MRSNGAHIIVNLNVVATITIIIYTNHIRIG